MEEGIAIEANAHTEVAQAAFQAVPARLSGLPSVCGGVPRIRTATGLFTLEAYGCCAPPLQERLVCIPCCRYTKTP